MSEQVYFIAHEGRIKIGYSKRAKTRIAGYATYLVGPIETIGIIDAGVAEERALHKHFNAHHLAGEWFSDCSAVREQIAIVLTGGLAALGLEVEPVAEKTRRPFVQSPRAPNLIPRLAFMMWGHNAATEMARELEQDEATCRGWLTDESTMPKMARMAFSVLVTFWAFDRKCGE